MLSTHIQLVWHYCADMVTSGHTVERPISKASISLNETSGSSYLMTVLLAELMASTIIKPLPSSVFKSACEIADHISLSHCKDYEINRLIDRYVARPWAFLKAKLKTNTLFDHNGKPWIPSIAKSRIMTTNEKGIEGRACAIGEYEGALFGDKIREHNFAILFLNQLMSCIVSLRKSNNCTVYSAFKNEHLNHIIARIFVSKKKRSANQINHFLDIPLQLLSDREILFFQRLFHNLSIEAQKTKDFALLDYATRSTKNNALSEEYLEESLMTFYRAKEEDLTVNQADYLKTLNACELSKKTRRFITHLLKYYLIDIDSLQYQKALAACILWQLTGQVYPHKSEAESSLFCQNHPCHNTHNILMRYQYNHVERTKPCNLKQHQFTHIFACGLAYLLQENKEKLINSASLELLFIGIKIRLISPYDVLVREDINEKQQSHLTELIMSL